MGYFDYTTPLYKGIDALIEANQLQREVLETCKDDPFDYCACNFAVVRVITNTFGLKKYIVKKLMKGGCIAVCDDGWKGKGILKYHPKVFELSHVTAGRAKDVEYSIVFIYQASYFLNFRSKKEFALIESLIKDNKTTFVLLG